MSRPEFSELPEQQVRLAAVLVRQMGFLDARETMGEANNLDSVVEYLAKEIDELNGHASDGMSLEQYRRQEVADVCIFALDLMNALGIVINPQQFEAEVARYNVQLRDYQYAATEVDWQYPQKYETVKLELKDRGDELVKLNAALMGENFATKQEKLGEKLIQIFVLCEVLFALLGTTFFYEEAEKRARNDVKYPAKIFQRDSGLTYQQAREKGKQTFAGMAEHPLDLSSMDRRSRLYQKLSRITEPGDYVIQLHKDETQPQHFHLDEKYQWTYLVPVPINDFGETVQLGNIEFYADFSQGVATKAEMLQRQAVAPRLIAPEISDSARMAFIQRHQTR